MFDACLTTLSSLELDIQTSAFVRIRRILTKLEPSSGGRCSFLRSVLSLFGLDSRMLDSYGWVGQATGRGGMSRVGGHHRRGCQQPAGYREVVVCCTGRRRTWTE